MSNGLIFESNGEEIDLTITQGASGSVTFTFPYDLTGYSARFEVAASYGETPAMQLAIGSGITIDSASESESVLRLHPTATQTGGIGRRFTGKYNLEIESASGQVTRVLDGSVKVDPQVKNDD